ncbi:hypothetical protein DDB_G0288301 [Dictyostelium discoideum AX4]|uniref:EGF-like domain-containing protein n=1 Tax=Dictyostelium discoideum TaxID=44689 RepID=Q54J46_DICDI|nr:hypothetical protein DDB_G0288301 [Dictyostelium discoideum AX4]EAL63293.1 hypothetical protein DDB_G0288301 [Dictyostelium discoideum AX4]|eukprot:XP_636801.1 hypothetical protein DDB_G0288301 [Dictyostelium discoideum AX4]
MIGIVILSLILFLFKELVKKLNGCDVSIKYYNEPISDDYIANVNGNCSQKICFLAISNKNISDISAYGIPFTLLHDPFFGPISYVELSVFSNTSSPSTIITIAITENDGAITHFFKTTYCLLQETTNFQLVFKNSPFFLNEPMSIDSEFGTNSGGPKMVVQFIGNTPSVFKKFSSNSLFNSTVKLLGNKATSRLYEVTMFPISMPSINFENHNLTYKYNSGSGELQTTSSFTPIYFTESHYNTFFPAINSKNNIIYQVDFQFTTDIYPYGSMVCTNCYIFLVANNGSRVQFLIYFNKIGSYNSTGTFSNDALHNNMYFTKTITIKPDNFSNGTEMTLVFQDTAFGTTPMGFSAILTGVPVLPNTPVTIYYPSGLKRQLWFNQPPFGLIDGFMVGLVNKFNVMFTIKLSKYMSGTLRYSFNSNNQKSPIEIPLPTQIDPQLIDTESPIVTSAIVVGDIGKMKLVIQMAITDDISGFSAFVCLDTNEIIFDYKNLMLGGTINNGVYSFIYDYGFTPVCKNSAFLDFAGNAQVQNQPFTDFIRSFINATTNIKYLMMNTPSYQAKTLSDFQEFYFAFNNISLTNQGFYNTLYFKFKDNNNDPDYCIKFRLAISGGYPNPIDYYSIWDNNLQMYKVEFYIPPNLSKINILYYIYLGLDYETQYSTSHFQSWVSSNNATLSVYSNIGDMMPPLVRSLLISPSTVDSDSFLNYYLIIEDVYNGFGYGEITIMGSVDFIQWNFTFSSGENKNPLVDVYNFSIYIPKCISQSYNIYHLKLVDKAGVFSEYTFGKSQPFPIIDPLVKIVVNEYKFNCSVNLYSNSLPVLKDFTFEPLSIDVGGPDSSRTVIFKMVVDGAAKAGSKPTIYLGDTYINYVTVPVLSDGVFDPIANITTFTVSTIIPYGFGYPEGILLNVFGIQTTYSTFQGYSSLDLRDANFTYTLLTPTFSSYPKMTSYLPISANGGELTIFGRELSTIANSFYRIIYSVNSSNSTPVASNINVKYISNVAIKLNVSSTTGPFTIEYTTSSKTIDTITIYPYHDYWNPNPVTPTPTETPTVPPTIAPTETPTVPPTNPPQKCGGNPQCGGESKGNCVNGVGCVCISPWIGSECQSRIITIPPPVIDPTNPNQNLTLNSTGTNEFTLVSLVSLVSLRELNFKNELVRSFRFDKWKLISNTTTDSNYITDVIDPKNNNTICSVNVSTTWYQTKTDIEFAGQKLTMNPSTLKYNINITSFPFTYGLNTLQLVMSATAQSTSQQDDQCSSNEFGDTTSNDNSNYLQLSVNQHSLYGRFIKRGIVDNNIKSIGNEILKDLSSENSYYISQSYIGINIPFYKESVQLDPDFSVLLDQRSASSICNNKGNKLSKGAIIGISIGCAAFTIIVVTLVAILLKNKYFFKSVQLKVIKMVAK